MNRNAVADYGQQTTGEATDDRDTFANECPGAGPRIEEFEKAGSH
jgi:hypothetical protein